MIETTMARPLLALLHVSDSLFPIGGFGYSDGLEAATAAAGSPSQMTSALAASFLAGDDARWITGQVIVAAGGKRM